MTTLENAQLKLECLKMAEKAGGNPLNTLQRAKEYYQWIYSQEPLPKACINPDRGNSNIDNQRNTA